MASWGHSSGSLMGGGGGGGGGDLVQEKKRTYVKKPLNAYMLFMKEMRQTVIEECTLKESAAINQILGRKVSMASAAILASVAILVSSYSSIYVFYL